MVKFKLGQIAEFFAEFDTAEKLDSCIIPYLWQRGPSYYYVAWLAEKAKQFKIDLTVNGKDLEETVWRYLCIAKESGAALAKNSLLAVKNDGWVVMRQVYELFAGNCKPEDVLAAGKQEGKRGSF